MNSLTLSGNITADPELRTGASGVKFATFSVANNELVNGERKLNGFFDITAFGQQAEHIAAGLKKGDRVVVTGRLQQRTFEREDGSTGRRVGIVAEAVASSLEFNAVEISRPVKAREESDEEE